MQAERNVHPATQKQYLSKLRVITSMLNETPDIRMECLETIDGVACRHTGAAKDIFVLKPITKNIGAYIRKRSSGHRGQTREVEIAAIEDDENLGTNLIIVSSQTFQNYKSALRWWHEYSNVSMAKVGHAWPTDVNDAINIAIASYKRVVGEKKWKGIMRIKDGKLRIQPFWISGDMCKFYEKGSYSKEPILARTSFCISIYKIIR